MIESLCCDIGWMRIYENICCVGGEIQWQGEGEFQHFSVRMLKMFLVMVFSVETSQAGGHCLAHNCSRLDTLLRWQRNWVKEKGICSVPFVQERRTFNFWSLILASDGLIQLIILPTYFTVYARKIDVLYGGHKVKIYYLENNNNHNK